MLGGLSAAALSLSCLSPLETENPDPVEDVMVAPEIVGLLVSDRIPVDGRVSIELSGPVRPLAEDWPVVVRTIGGSLVGSHGSLAAGGLEIDVLPLAGWPLSSTLFVTVGPGFVGQESDLPLSRGERMLSFRTVDPDPEPAMAEVVFPVPGQASVANAAFVVLRLSEGTDPPPELVLKSEGDRWVARAGARASRQQVRYDVPLRVGPCPRLCAASIYTAEFASPLVLPFPDGPRREIRTSTTNDTAPPEVLRADLHLENRRLRVDLDASEPVWLTGLVACASRTGTVSSSIAPEMALFAEGHLEARVPEACDGLLTVTVVGEDVAGHPLAPRSMRSELEASPVVVINEIVASPLRDWNDSDGDGSGVPYDEYPGRGAVTEADQWIELVNLSAAPLDLVASSLSIAIEDTSPTITDVAHAPALRFGAGGTIRSWWPGEALVVRPRGQISKKDVRIAVSSGGDVITELSLGEGGAHEGGAPPDLIHEAVGRDGRGVYRWCRPTPGDSMPAADSDCLAR